MTKYTDDYLIPYPESGDSVKPQSRDLVNLAVTMDQKLTLAKEQAVVKARWKKGVIPDGVDVREFMYGADKEGQYTSMTISNTATMLGLPQDLVNDPRSFTAVSQTLGNGVTIKITTYNVWGVAEYTCSSAPSTGDGWTAWKKTAWAEDLKGAGGGSNSASGFKTLPLALTAGQGGTTKGLASASVEYDVELSSSIFVSRYRIAMRDGNPRFGSSTAQSIALSNIKFGGVQKLGSAATNADGSMWFSPWMSGDFGNLSFNYTAPSAPSLMVGGGKVNGVRKVNMPFELWLEVEVPVGTPAMAILGDSNSVAVNTTIPLHDAYLAIYGRDKGIFPVFYGSSGDAMSEHLDPDLYKWNKWAHLDKADLVLNALGANDFSSSGGTVTLAEMQERCRIVWDIAAEKISPIQHVGLIKSRGTPIGNSVAVRKGLNSWFKTLPLGLREWHDIASPVTTGDAGGVLPQYLSSDGVHMNTAGHQAIAAAITKTTTVAVSAGPNVTEDPDDPGFYTIGGEVPGAGRLVSVDDSYIFPPPLEARLVANNTAAKNAAIQDASTKYGSLPGKVATAILYRGKLPTGTDLNALTSRNDNGIWDLSATDTHYNKPFSGAGKVTVNVGGIGVGEMRAMKYGSYAEWVRGISNAYKVPKEWTDWLPAQFQPPNRGVLPVGQNLDALHIVASDHGTWSTDSSGAGTYNGWPFPGEQGILTVDAGGNGAAVQHAYPYARNVEMRRVLVGITNDTWTSWKDTGGAGADTEPVAAYPETSDPTAPLESSTTRLTMWGDSLTHAGGIATRLAALMPGVTISNKGVSGQNAAQVSGRQGATNSLITLTGDEIPASGAATVAARAPAILAQTGYPARSESGRLAGVNGTLSNPAGSVSYTFTRATAGDKVPCPPGTPFYADVGKAARDETQIIWVGRNNLDNTIADTVMGMARHLSPAYKRFLVLSITSTPAEVRGTEKYKTIVAMNEEMQYQLGVRFVDLRRWLIDSALGVMGLSPTPEDTAAIAGDTVPPALTTDGVHFTGSAQTAIANYLHPKLVELGL